MLITITLHQIMKVNEKLWKLLLLQKNHQVDSSLLGWQYNGKSITKIKCIDDAVVLPTSSLALLFNKANPQVKSLVYKRQFKKITLPYKGFSLYANSWIMQDELITLQNYWVPSILGQVQSGLPFVFIHSAISLDGYLATVNGDSKQIGNYENLVHAHRLRALFDAVLVGSHTFFKDKPLLTVRHVSGKNPKRLILSNKSRDFSALNSISSDKTFLLRSLKYQSTTKINCFDKIIFFDGNSKKECMLNLLQKCKAEKIDSILVEGGGTTLSAFIETGLADTIQFHLSPILFGSGIKAVQLSNINSVNEALQLENILLTHVGDSFMVTAYLP